MQLADMEVSRSDLATDWRSRSDGESRMGGAEVATELAGQAGRGGRVRQAAEEVVVLRDAAADLEVTLSARTRSRPVEAN